MALRFVLGRVKSNANVYCKTKISALISPIKGSNHHNIVRSSPLYFSLVSCDRYCSSVTHSVPAARSEGLETCIPNYTPRNFGYKTLVKAATSKRVNAAAQFALNKQNEEETAPLEFVRVVGAVRLLVAGLRYHIILEAMDGGQLKKYLAVVWVQPWLKSMKLCKWKHIGDDIQQGEFEREDDLQVKV